MGNGAKHKIYDSLGLQLAMICGKLNEKSVIVKRIHRGVLRGGSAWAEATSRTGRDAKRGLVAETLQAPFLRRVLVDVL